MRIAAELITAAPVEGRRSSRSSSARQVGLEAQSAMRLRAQIVNFSCHGCRVDVVGEPLEQGQLVTLKVAAWQPWKAKVVWSKRGSAGLEFVHPIHPALVHKMIPSASHLTEACMRTGDLDHEQALRSHICGAGRLSRGKGPLSTHSRS